MTKFSEAEMCDLIKLRLGAAPSGGQSLPDYLSERGYKGATFIEQLGKIGGRAIEVKREEVAAVRQHQQQQPSIKRRKEATSIINVWHPKGRARSMPRLYHAEDALAAGVPWAERASHHLQNAAALRATLPPRL